MNNYIYNQMVYFTIMFDFTWSVSDCEELVGVTHRRRCDCLCGEFYFLMDYAVIQFNPFGW